MHTDVNVSFVEFDRRSVRPHLQLTQLLDWHVLQRTDPLSWNQEASIPVREDFDGIPLRDVANALGLNFGLCFGSVGGKRRRVPGIADLLCIYMLIEVASRISARFCRAGL